MPVRTKELWTVPQGGEEYADPLGIVTDRFIAGLGAISTIAVECTLASPVSAQANAFPHITDSQREYFTILSQYPGMEGVIEQTLIDLNRRQRTGGVSGQHSDL